MTSLDHHVSRPSTASPSSDVPSPSAPSRGLPPSSTMQAMVYDGYGDASVLHPGRLPVPLPLPGQVLIEVWASSVNPVDFRMRRGELKGLLPGGFPRVPGYDVAGVIVDSASDAAFQSGDRVMAFLNSARGGACAEYAVCAVDAVVKLPTTIPTDIAAAMPLAGSTALQSLRDKGSMKPGDRVLVNGASGGVGMFAVQIAKAYGCHVDAVASGANREFCLSIGADRFYDYQQTDFTKLGECWDLIFDAAGKARYRDARRVLKPSGRFVSTEPSVKGLLMTLLTWILPKSGSIMLAKPRADDLRELVELYVTGKLKVTIDSRFPMTELAQAHRRVEHGVDRGKVVLLSDKYQPT